MNKYFAYIRKIGLIDKKWLNDFLSSCNYNQIKTKVKNEKIEIKDDYQIFANYFAKNYPLSPQILDNKPKEAEKKFNNYEYYYDEYNFIDEKTLNIFCQEFNIIFNFKKNEITIKTNLIIFK